jgi:hypothetical protein
MSGVFIWIYLGVGGATFMKHFERGRRKLWKFGNLWCTVWTVIAAREYRMSAQGKKSNTKVSKKMVVMNQEVM